MAKVLVVDDDEVTRLILGRILENAGHQVTYAGDEMAAMRIFRIGRFEVVFTDLAMPEKNGLLLINELRAQDWKLPLIAMAGENAEQLILAEDFGAREILYKPLEPETVLAAPGRVVEDEDSSVWDLAWG